MKLSSRNLLWVVVVCAVAVCAAAEDDADNWYKDARGDVEVAVKVKFRCDYIGRWLGGVSVGRYSDRDDCPRKFIDKLEVTYKSQPVHVPAVAYNDLSGGRPHIYEREDGVYSVVIGYHTVSVLRFEGERLLYRIVHAREFWDQWQLTRRGITEYVFDAENGSYIARTPRDEYHDIPAEEGNVKVLATVRKHSTGNCRKVANNEDWAVDNLCPMRQVQKLVVSYLGEDVWLPVSAYNDLAGMNDVSVELTEDGMYTVFIEGEDDRNSYKASLFFDGLSITRRTVLSGKDTIYTEEETEYSYD